MKSPGKPVVRLIIIFAILSMSVGSQPRDNTMPAIRHDDILLRILKDLNDVRSVLKRVVATLPLFDIANENTPAQLTGNQNNYVPGNYDILRLSSTGPYIITGIRGGMKGRRLQIFNVGNYTLAFSHQNTLSDPENRFKFNTGLSAFVEAGQNITIYYDSTQQRWIEATNVFDYDIAAVWDTQTVPAGSWRRVAWSETLGLLVAVGYGGNYVMTSPDGITWTAQTPAANNIWEGVAWSPSLGLFAAVSRDGTGDRVMTSPDGVIWTSQVSAADNDWYGIAWSPDLSLFVAVAASAAANQVMTSTDGITWSSETLSSALWKDIVWADTLGLFVAVSENSVTNDIATSPDGVAWTVRSKTSNEGLYDIAWSHELGLLVAIGNNCIYTSSNGTNWTRVSTLTASSRAIAWSKELRMFLVIDTSGTVNQWSGDGTTWSSATGIGGTSIVWANTISQFVAVATNAAYTTP